MPNGIYFCSVKGFWSNKNMKEKDMKEKFIEGSIENKEVDSDLAKFLNVAHGKKIDEHTYLTPNQIKSIRGLKIVAHETGDKFFNDVANDCMTLQLSENGKNRAGIERVFTGIYSPALTYKRQELENEGNGEDGSVLSGKKTKKGLLRRFL